MPHARRRSTCSFRFSSTLATTRSGDRSRISSSFGFFWPPTLIFRATPARGSTQYAVTPMIASSRPSANSVSVMLGISETMRRGSPPSASACPLASVSARGVMAVRPALLFPAKAVHQLMDLAESLGHLRAPLRTILRRRRVVQTGHGHAEHLQDAARLLTRHHASPPRQVPHNASCLLGVGPNCEPDY